MKKDEVFPSKYFKASTDLEQEVHLTIRDLTRESFGEEDDRQVKSILWFVETDKGLVLNKTNWSILCDIYTFDDTEELVGYRITLYREKVSFKGDRVWGTRIKEEIPDDELFAGEEEEVPF